MVRRKTHISKQALQNAQPKYNWSTTVCSLWPADSKKVQCAAAAAAKSLQSCLTLCDPKDSSPPGSRPWDSPSKNTGEGCHCLLQCMKVKSESEVAQSCPTLRDPTDCSLPGSSIHGSFQARALEWGAIAFSGSVIEQGNWKELQLLWNLLST